MKSKIFLLLSVFVFLAMVSFAFGRIFCLRFPDANEVQEVRITYLYGEYIVPYDEINNFIDSLSFELWKPCYTYDLKFASICSIQFQPYNKCILILGADNDIAYAKFNGMHYTFPAEIYESILVNAE